MFDMVKNSILLFFQGRLFADPVKALTQLAVGVVFTTLSFVAGVRFGHLPFWGAAIISGFLGGTLQPYLFRSLKYR